MFGTSKEAKQETGKRSYEIKVEAARATKNDAIIMVDLDVNGIKIKSCMLKEATVTNDGDKYKKGDKCYFLNFPSEKGDKCYFLNFPSEKVGDKYKKGDKCYFLIFPSEKVGDKYYNRVWFPVSNENLEDIINQVKALL